MSGQSVLCSTTDGGFATHLEATDIVRPESEPGTRQAETSSEGFCHGFVGRLAVSSPL